MKDFSSFVAARRVPIAWLLTFAIVLQMAPIAAATPTRPAVRMDEAVLDSFTVTPETLYTNQSGTGTVGLSTPAPAGGMGVSLSSSSASITVPATVTVGAGNMTASFAIARAASANAGTATITATVGGINRTVTVSLADGPALAGVTLTPSALPGG
ncbi:MAG TPA: hypothetical protein VN605_07275, partial [Thermoanaerobaculia bacterium]|nr:hypothetical protein [Thermoanaerobaculia bacterium]